MIGFFDTLACYNGIGADGGLGSKWVIFAGTNPTLIAGRSSPLQLIQFAMGTFSGSWGSAARPYGFAGATGGVGFVFSQSVLPGLTTCPICILDTAGALQLGFIVTNTGALAVYRTTNGASTGGPFLGATPAGVILPNTLHELYIGVTISDTVGEIRIYVDDMVTPKLTLSGIDTKASSLANLDVIRFGPMNGNPGADCTYKFGEVYTKDSLTPLSSVKFEAKAVTSDIAQGFTRSSGADNFALVDELPVSDADYVSSSVANTTDLYGVADLTGTPATIHAVQIAAMAKKMDAGARAIRLQAKSGATTSDGPDFNLITSSAKYERLMETDPATAAAWLAAAVNALQIGAKVAP